MSFLWSSECYGGSQHDDQRPQRKLTKSPIPWILMLDQVLFTALSCMSSLISLATMNMVWLLPPFYSWECKTRNGNIIFPNHAHNHEAWLQIQVMVLARPALYSPGLHEPQSARQGQPQWVKRGTSLCKWTATPNCLVSAESSIGSYRNLKPQQESHSLQPTFKGGACSGSLPCPDALIIMPWFSAFPENQGMIMSYIHPLATQPRKAVGRGCNSSHWQLPGPDFVPCVLRSWSSRVCWWKLGFLSLQRAPENTADTASGTVHPVYF